MITALNGWKDNFNTRLQRTKHWLHFMSIEQLSILNFLRIRTYISIYLCLRWHNSMTINEITLFS